MPESICHCRLAVALVLIASLGGCVAGPLARGPSSAAASPTGHWLLDAAASDDAQKAIVAALPPVPKPDERPYQPPGAGQPSDDTAATRRGRGGQGQRSGQGNALTGDDSGPRLRLSERLQFVRAVVVPADDLILERSGDVMTILQADRQRRVELGAEDPSTVTDHYGSRRIRAGFSGNDLRVESEDHGHVSISELWRRAPEPDTLVSEVTLKAWNFKTIHVRAVYHRAPADQAAVLRSSEGPTPGPVR
jgi:hypothetical protein